MVTSTLVRRATERRSIYFANTDHRWPQEVLLAVRVGQHLFRVHLNLPSLASLVLLHHCHNSISDSTLPGTSTSIALRHQGTRDKHNPTRHRRQGVRFHVATKLLASERALANLVRSEAEARLRPLLRHTRCTSPIIMTPLQIL